jgi:hypothetical protein
VYNSHLTIMDVNNDRCVELPFVTDPTAIPERCNPAAEAAGSRLQATKQQVVGSVLTHETWHAVGGNNHFDDPSGADYRYANNGRRAGHFSDAAGALIQIHNGGVQ